jgi:hypothetical protein
VPTAFTRRIQARNGYRPVPAACPACGTTRPLLRDFPATNVLGLSALLWTTQGRPIPFGRSLRCPTCGEPMSVDEALRRDP